MVVVADSSPLIYFSRLGILDVLATVYGTVVVPRAVWDEVVQRRPSSPGVEALTGAVWIQIDDASHLSVDLGLDPGETAAILLAESIHADLLLIDERIGRKIAEARGLTVRGTLGVLVHARQVGAIPGLRPVLDALVGEGFRIAPALIQAALFQVGEVVASQTDESTGRG